MDFVSNKIKVVSDPISKVAKRVATPVVHTVDTISNFFTDRKSQEESSKNKEEVNKQAQSNAKIVESVQQLFNTSLSTTQNSHDFRNKRHSEFLEHNPFAVRIKSIASPTNIVVFRVTPDIQESRHVGYKSLDPLHMPGNIQIFQNTAPRVWQMSGLKLISRNGVEAEENLTIVNQFRAWQMPFFGKSQTSGIDGFEYEMYGAPPEVLEFTAYSKPGEQGISNIRKIPVIITTFSVSYPSDVDYIRTEKTNQPFPAVTTIDISLLETHSPNEYLNFNINDYKNGKLIGF